MNNIEYIKNIDNLGRIVIPKEIREILRIKTNDSLKIYLDNQNIILKKHSIINEKEGTAKNIVEAIHYFINHNIIISDRDTIVACVAKDKKELLNKPISNRLINAIERHEQIYENNKKKLPITSTYEIYGNYIISSIIYKGSVTGLIIVFDEKKEITMDDYRAIQIITKFLNKYLEE